MNTEIQVPVLEAPDLNDGCARFTSECWNEREQEASVAIAALREAMSAADRAGTCDDDKN